jgi:hypothetical protein
MNVYGWYKDRVGKRSRSVQVPFPNLVPRDEGFALSLLFCTRKGPIVDESLDVELSFHEANQLIERLKLCMNERSAEIVPSDGKF